MTDATEVVTCSTQIIDRESARATGAAVYFTGEPCQRGHVAQRNVSNQWCVKCSSDWYASRYVSEKNGRGLEHRNAKARENRRKNPDTYALINIKRRAKNSGMEFSLQKSDLTFPDNCQCCGQFMEIGAKENGAPTRSSPSVDRINSSRGYTPDNIAFICFRCNTLKKDGTLSEFENLVAYMKKMGSRTVVIPSFTVVQKVS